jgi:hypothetical protein
MWQTLRTHAQAGATPQTVILSAKHGFVSTGEMLDPYDQQMTAQSADRMLANPKKLAEAVLGALNNGQDAVIRDVQIVGGSEYRRSQQRAFHPFTGSEASRAASPAAILAAVDAAERHG